MTDSVSAISAWVSWPSVIVRVCPGAELKARPLVAERRHAEPVVDEVSGHSMPALRSLEMHCPDIHDSGRRRPGG